MRYHGRVAIKQFQRSAISVVFEIFVVGSISTVFVKVAAKLIVRADFVFGVVIRRVVFGWEQLATANFSDVSSHHWNLLRPSRCRPRCLRTFATNPHLPRQ
jgi:hypothetical protein